MRVLAPRQKKIFEGYRGGHFEAYLATFLRRIRQGGVSEFVPVELTAGLTP